MRITKENTLTLVVDYQEKLAPHLYEYEEFIKRSQILLKGLKALDIPMLITTQYAKGLGDTVSDIEEIVANYPTYDKISFSAIGCSEVRDYIESHNIKNIILCGCESHICVMQTLIDTRELGINVYFVADCITSRKASDKKYAIKRAMAEGAYITSSEAILFELLVDAKHPVFKTISALVK